MSDLEVIQQPTLLLDEARARSNIARMADKARQSGVTFRPHFKTHQSAHVGNWFRDFGVRAITVSSVAMAAYFAAHGWDDVMLALPVNLRQTAAIDELAGQIRLQLLLEAPEVARRLAQQLSRPVEIWLKVDAGYGRTGIQWDDTPGLIAAGRAVAGAQRLRLKGLLSHAGDTYRASSPDQALALYERSVDRLNRARSTLRDAGFDDLLLSVGDSPGCSLAPRFDRVDEIRPGNFVFYDFMQVMIGSCTPDDVAVALACPVVARHPQRGVIVLYGGAVHLSKEAWPAPGGLPVYGPVARPQGDSWSDWLPDVWVTSLSQEHGLISAGPEVIAPTREGDLLLVTPVHSCLTANLMGRYLTRGGDWIPMARL